MIVYRVEDENGLGAFASSLVRNAMVDCSMAGIDYLSPTRHPCPNDEIYEFRSWWENDYVTASKYHFGFESIEQLLNWFDDRHIRKAMRINGGVVQTYHINPRFVVKGGYQLVFYKKLARLGDKMGIPV